MVSEDLFVQMTSELSPEDDKIQSWRGEGGTDIADSWPLGGERRVLG